MLESGLYDSLFDEDQQAFLESHSELHAVLSKLDPEEEPERYADFIFQAVAKALASRPEYERYQITCEVLNFLDLKIPQNNIVLPVRNQQKVLHAINRGTEIQNPRPITPLNQTSLFTGAARDPALHTELCKEMQSADRIDVLVSFIKWSGLRLILEALTDASNRGVSIRVITTSYMGASDPEAVIALSRLPQAEIRISYDTERTRLHAKAWHFFRKTGFSTAYIGSSNLSNPAMTSGLEWNLKICQRDDPHILEKFIAEFDTYWNSREFAPFDADTPGRFVAAINACRSKSHSNLVFFDLMPHPFQERILESIKNDREVHNRNRNLIIAATGTGKTIIAAFDYHSLCEPRSQRPRLLFVAHRQEILDQALMTFRAVLKDANFGELMIGSRVPETLDHLFCSVQLLASRRLWEQTGPDWFEHIIVDEVHHGTAASYRALFDHFTPKTLVGLTATPERLDGADIRNDFGGRFTAEIRLPDALEEKLLCPFQYFGISDPIALTDQSLWQNGKYATNALEKIYIADDIRAKQRLDCVIQALDRYQPGWAQDESNQKAIGFCAGIKHAEYMAKKFQSQGIKAECLTGSTDTESRNTIITGLRSGNLKIVFTVDVLSEGVDIPEINLVMFLRPTESLTIFLQQLGRGLRHSPGKECLTVLDFVGQYDRRYNIGAKFTALLKTRRLALIDEIEDGFPHLPPGCSLQLEKVARQQVIAHIRESLKDFEYWMLEELKGFQARHSQTLSLQRFLQYHDISPYDLLAKKTWSQWKYEARLGEKPVDEHSDLLTHKSLIKFCRKSTPGENQLFKKILNSLRQDEIINPELLDNPGINILFRRIWAGKGHDMSFSSYEQVFYALKASPAFLDDANELLDWVAESNVAYGVDLGLPFECPLQLHGEYDNLEIQAALGKAGLHDKGQRGVGILHFLELKTFVLLVTFQKTEKEFSPSTMYADYPISRELVHWQSQSDTSQASNTGQLLCHHQRHGYTLLLCVRSSKKVGGFTSPFTFLGPVEVASFNGERPISFTLKLKHLMPVEFFEDNRRGG